MEIQEVKQNTPEWINWRFEGIGASDAPAILGLSRFKTRQELLTEKITKTSQSKPRSEFITKQGHEVEDAVRIYLSGVLQTKFSPRSYGHNSFSFLRASTDGTSECGKYITEIKLLSRGVYGKAPNKEADGYVRFMEAKNHGVVPKDYYPQLQHQLFVTGAEKCIFVGFRSEPGKASITEEQIAIVDVYPDKHFIKNMLAKECEFWYDVLEGRKKLEELE